MFMKLRKLKVVDNEFEFYIKKTGFFNICIRNKWKCKSLCFYFMIGFLWCFYLNKYFFDAVRNKLQTINIYTRVGKKKIKSLGKEYVIKTHLKYWPMKKIFPKTVSQWEFDYGLFTNLPRIITTCDFSMSLFKLQRGILPLLTKLVC